MSSYIVKVNEELQRDPFRVLLLESIAKSPSVSLQDKSLLLTQLETQLKDLEINHEATGAKNHWLTITSGFSSALAIAGMSAVTPPFGWMFGGLAVVSAITTLGATQKTKASSSPIIETLKRHRLALDSQEALQWAVLWTYAGVDLFCFALNQASQGYVSGSGQLMRRDGDSPFSAAISYLARCQGIKYETLVATLTQIKDGSPVEPTQVTLPSAIGEQTRLGAVDVVPSPVSVSAPQVTLPCNADGFIKPKVDNQLERLWSVVDRNQSFFVVGSKGTGKGMFTANLLRRKLDQHPNAIALVFDPKGDSKEAGYWNHRNIIRYSFIGIMSDQATWEEKASEFINQAIQYIGQVDVTKGRRLYIVFDEFLALKANLSKPAFEEVKRLCTNGISMGDSFGVHAIAITQSFNSGDSMDSEEMLRNMTLVGLFGKDEYSRANKIVKYGKTNLDGFNSGEFSSLVSKSEINRVMCLAGDFIPSPKLPNYSDYCRDSQSVVQSTQEVKTNHELAKFEKQLTQTLEKSQARGVDITRVDIDKVCAKVPQFTRDEVEKVIKSVLGKLTQSKVGV